MTFHRLPAFTALLLLGSAPVASAGTNTVTFSTAGEYPIVVPAGVTSLNVVAIGGKGGAGNYHVDGGFGARVTGALAVTGGATRYVVVAGNGEEGSAQNGAGSGGGASDVRTTPLAQGVTPTDTRVLVAGGGGGSGRGVNEGAAGTAGIGGNAGQPGGAARGGGSVAGGGAAGTAVGGGAGGIGTPDWGESGTPGLHGLGGPGGYDDWGRVISGGFNGGGATGGGLVEISPGMRVTLFGGGGGGGGLHGGGGGAGIGTGVSRDAGGGGGGGSSLAPAGGAVTTDTTGSPSVTISFADTVAPVVSLDAPPIATNADVTVSGTGGTVLGDLDVTIDVFAGPTASGVPVTSKTASRGAFQVPLGALPEGQYSVRATQTDGGGNVGTSVTRTFVNDTTLPVLSLTAPQSGAATNDATPTFEGVAGTTARDGATVQLIVFTALGQILAAPDGQRDGSTGRYAIPLPGALPDGTYFAGARQTDSAGNTGESNAIAFTIDTAAPAPTLDAVPVRSGDTTPTFAGSGTAATGDAAAVQVRVYPGATATGTPAATLGAPLAAGRFTVDAAALPDGTYTAQATQLDSAGNVGTTAARTFTIDTTPPVVDPPAPGVDPPAPGVDPPGPVITPIPSPTVSPGTPSSDAQAPALSRVSLSATRLRAGRGTTLRYTLSEPATLTITITRPGRKLTANTLTQRAKQGANRFAFNGRLGKKALPRGRYTLTLRAVDASGNRSATKKVTVRVG